MSNPPKEVASPKSSFAKSFGNVLAKGASASVGLARKSANMTVSGLQSGANITAKMAKKSANMTVSGLQSGANITAKMAKKSATMTASGIGQGASLTFQGLKKSADVTLQIGSLVGTGLKGAADLLSLSAGDLAKLVPIFLEDAASGNENSISQLLEFDSKTDQFSIISQRDKEYRTALHKASLEGHAGVMKLLVNYINNYPELSHLIDAPDYYGSTPFFLVCMKYHRSDSLLAEYLLSAGAKVDLVKIKSLMTGLHWAAYHGALDLVKVICYRPGGKALLHRKTAEGKFPIDMAGEQYMKKVYEESDQDVGDSILPDFLKGNTTATYSLLIKELLMFGDKNLQHGKDALDDDVEKEYRDRQLYWACVVDDANHVSSALEANAKSNAVGHAYKKQTPFHGAARHGSIACLKLLLETKEAHLAIDKRDNDGNTPLLDCVRMSNFHEMFRTRNGEAVQLLLDAGADDTCVNCQNYRAIQYAKEPGIKALLSSTEAAIAQANLRPPLSWDWVLVFAKGFVNVRHGLEPQYTKVANWLRKRGLDVDVFGSMVNEEEVFVCVHANNLLLRETAEKFREPVRLLADREYKPYTQEEDFLFAPFKTQERLEITMRIIEDALDLEAYLTGGVVKRTFSVHDESELEPIRRRWINAYQPFAAWRDYVTDVESNSMEDLNYVRSYYGEKVAMYYAWVCHYTATLSYIVMFSLAIAIYQFWINESNSGFLAFYAIVLTLWATYSGETWKRKQEELAFRWDMLEYENTEKARSEFYGDEAINPKTGFVEKAYSDEERLFKKLFTVPVLFGFALGIFAGFIAVQTWRVAIDDEYTGTGLTMMKVLASTAYAFVLVVFDILWNGAAVFLTDWENHRTETEWEDNYIFKKFSFMLVNNTLAAFYTAFVEQDIDKLYLMMWSLIVVKQVTNYLKDTKLPLATTWPKRKKLQAQVAAIDLEVETEWGYTIQGRPELSKEDCLRARLEVSENDVMIPFKRTDQYYAEYMIQYAFIVFFSPAFPLAALVCWLFNIALIRGEMIVNTSVAQRAPTTGAKDIGSWQMIQEGMCLASMVVNVGLLLFTMKGQLGTFYETWFPTYEARLWSLIVLEHILLLTKVAMVALIEDKPKWVIEAIAASHFRKNTQLEEAQREHLKTVHDHAKFRLNKEHIRAESNWGKLQDFVTGKAEANGGMAQPERGDVEGITGPSMNYLNPLYIKRGDGSLTKEILGDY